MDKIFNLLSIFLAGFLINFVSNIENFYSYVKIKLYISGIIGFICWVLTGLVFADILSSTENRFWLVFVLALGGGVGNVFSARLLKFFSRKKIRQSFAKKIKKIYINSSSNILRHVINGLFL